MTDKQKLELIRALIFDYCQYSAYADENKRSAAALLCAVGTVIRFGNDAEK